MERKMNKISIKIRYLLVLFFLANFVILTATGIRLYRYLFFTPCRLEVNCRGYGLDIDWMKQWENQERDGSQGILAMAGWNFAGRKEIYAVGVGRTDTAQLLKVYGSMEQVFPVRILSGVYGLAGRENACVLSRDLAEALFGSDQVTGEQVCLDGEEGEKIFLEIAGVIDREGKYMLVPMSEGEVERIAVLFDKRFQAREKMKENLAIPADSE
jgi:hypothetical protein